MTGAKEIDDEKSTELGGEVLIKDVDTAAALVGGEQGPLDPAEAQRVRAKIDRHILPMMCILYWVQFMDKTTLGSASILGIREATHLTTNQYNWLGTIFYISYLAFEFPQNLALQRFPVGKWISLNMGSTRARARSAPSCDERESRGTHIPPSPYYNDAPS